MCILYLIIIMFRSIDDDHIITDETEDTLSFSVVEQGSKRGKRKLVSSTGYTFVQKRTQKNGTVEWRCSVRGTVNSPVACPVVVKERTGMFEVSHSKHNHSAKPGILTAVRKYEAVRSYFIIIM